MKAPTETWVGLDPDRPALVVVDVQNDFCHADGCLVGIGFDVRPCAAAAARVEPVIEQARSRGLGA